MMCAALSRRAAARPAVSGVSSTLGKCCSFRYRFAFCTLEARNVQTVIHDLTVHALRAL